MNFSTGASMVLAQYYNFVRLGRRGYTYVMEAMQKNARALADNLRNSGRFEVIGSDLEQLPLVAFRLVGTHSYDESDIAWQLSAERGWMVPAYTLPPNADKVTSPAHVPPWTTRVQPATSNAPGSREATATEPSQEQVSWRARA